MIGQKHSKGLLCSKCLGNLKCLMHYNQSGAMVRAESLFYCDACKRVVKVSQEEVKLC